MEEATLPKFESLSNFGFGFRLGKRNGSASLEYRSYETARKGKGGNMPNVSFADALATLASQSPEMREALATLSANGAGYKVADHLAEEKPKVSPKVKRRRKISPKVKKEVKSPKVTVLEEDGEILENIAVTLKGSIMTLTVDLDQNSGLSSTKKNVLVGTSRGNRTLCTYKGKKIKAGLNIFHSKR